ncbi:MAG: endopeptidase La [Peptococcaceae bacterium]|nr:endopeptidase La [Peptococcaceae bacterium]
MFVLPLYEVLLVPGVNMYVRGEEFEEFALAPAAIHEDVVLLVAKEQKPRYAYTADDFYEIGVGGYVSAISQDGFVTIRTNERLQIDSVTVADDATLKVETTPLYDVRDVGEEERQTRLRAIKEALSDFAKEHDWGKQAMPMIENFHTIEEAGVSLSPWLAADNEKRYEVLTYHNERGRMEAIEQLIYAFIEVARASAEAMEMQREEYEQNMREQALRRQIDVLQQKLDEMHPEEASDLDRFAKAIEELPLNEQARAEANKVLNRLARENGTGNEYALLFDYMEYLLSLPWKKEEADDIDVAAAETILNEDHYGLKKVKNRVIEQIAVMALCKKQAGSILLFVGPPGTGKTSVGQSIARALGREYVRVSLGGVRDEADIRGHRRTYIGAMAGRIIDGIHKAGVSNPVMVLDEVDKLSASYNGDPASALLEVLDPEQNSNFVDHYLNVPFDLSDVFFVCTANTTETIPAPLLNRMEVIQFNGYTVHDKLAIAKEHLLAASYEQNGVPKDALVIPDDTLRALIDDYTMESGVRGLRKRIDTLCRQAAVKLAKQEEAPFTVQPDDLRSWLDMQPILHDHILSEKKPGVVTGLAWTQAGGEILFIETLFTKGSGKLLLTGKLGDVMKESAYLAMSLVKSMFPTEWEDVEKCDLHIHVPEGAVPKDGPSAGITLTTAIASLVTGRAVAPYYAMTGEVSLRGAITAIGGLPEKLMAAQRAGITTVFIPKENERDLADIDEDIKAGLTIVPVEDVHDVLEQVGIIEHADVAEEQ